MFVSEYRIGHAYRLLTNDCRTYRPHQCIHNKHREEHNTSTIDALMKIDLQDNFYLDLNSLLSIFHHHQVLYINSLCSK